MPGRIYTSATYRYGFNGKENDDEAKGITGSQQDYGFRVYDSRFCRFLSVDPLFKEFEWNSPFSYAVNNPIAFIDLLGQAPGLSNLVIQVETGVNKVITETEKKIAKKFVETTLKRAVRQAWWETVLCGAGSLLSRALGTLTFVLMDQGIGHGDIVMRQLAEEEEIELQNLQGKRSRGEDLSQPEFSRLQLLEVVKYANPQFQTLTYLNSSNSNTNLIREAVIGEQKFSFNTGHGFYRPHEGPNGTTDFQKDTKLNPVQIEREIALDALGHKELLPTPSPNGRLSTGPYKGTIVIDGHSIGYDAIKKDDGTINISTYYLMK